MRLAVDCKYQEDADQIIDLYGLNSYSQLFVFLLKTHGSKLIKLAEKS